MNQTTFKQVANFFKTLYDLSEDKIEVLKDEVINLIEARANLVTFFLWLLLQ